MENWQLKIFRKSLKKRQRVAKIYLSLPDLERKKCLELGCARGIIGYYLRLRGGQWISTDADLKDLRAAKSLLLQGVSQTDPIKLPFPNESFDLVTALDILEHLEDDESCIDEIQRVTKPGGYILISAPASGRFYLVNRLKELIGLPPEVYGHVREGYNPEELAQRFKQKGFIIQKIETFTHFFTEFAEMVINYGYVHVLNRKRSHQRDGDISPTSESELKKNIKTFKIYSFLFPFIWFFTRLDYLLFYQRGYTLLIRAIKE